MTLIIAAGHSGRRGQVTRAARNTVSAAALLIAFTPGFLRSADAQISGDSADAVERVVVTSTRIKGIDAPTPTTVLSAKEIQAQAEPNIFTLVNELPTMAGSLSTQVGNGSSSGGGNGVDVLNLRNLGINRTLVLLDGQRVVGANPVGVTDIAQFPQGLIQRVDVVTGGASASWGSDAVSGVVNFVLDHNFTGIKGNISASQTAYGDDKNVLVQLTGGTGFAGDKGHIEASGELFTNSGVPSGIGTRQWYQGAKILQQSIAATPPGTPQLINALHVASIQLAPGGLITSGPLQGTTFGPGGQRSQFQYGSPIISPFMVGGDQKSDIGSGVGLDASNARGTFYSRVSYNLNADTNIYATFNYGAVRTDNVPFQGEYKTANLTIQCSNPYLPGSVVASCAANGITSFPFGTDNGDFPLIHVNTIRNMRRMTAGGDGAFNAFGSDWSWDAYFEHGIDDVSVKDRNESLTNLYNLSIDAATAPGGAIVCRSTLTAPTNGCVPLNIIGTGVASRQALNSILGTAWISTEQRQEAGSFSVNGKPFSSWAGPVSIATGLEYREEAFKQQSDPYSQGNGGNPLLNSVGNNWFSGNFHPGRGSYHVAEAFVESNIPLLKDDVWGAADLNIAGREEVYSAAGWVSTWKVGMNYTPAFLDGVKFRALQSRDVRAPNLSDLYTAPTVYTQTVIDDFGPSAGQTFTISRPTIGNLALKPERGNTTELGVVLQPSWLPGFSTSVDYYRISLGGAISTLTNQQEMDLCFQGNQALCKLIVFNSALQPTSLTVQAINLASIITDGVDIESSWQTDMDNLIAGADGSLVLRSLATHVSKFVTHSGLPGLPNAESAGQNSGAVALWRWLGTASYGNDMWSAQLTGRYVSPGVYNPAYIQCTTGCPAPTLNNPTINNNQISGAFYTDIGGSVNLTPKGEGFNSAFYFKIDNLMDLDPATVSQSGSLALIGNATNPMLYDVLGRTYRIGLRIDE
jgi:iron complex outermembrane receptor protein